MEVRKGFKQTDVGIIPEDWEIKPLSDLTKEIGDGIHATPEYVNSSDYFFINGNNLLNGQIVIAENTMCVGSTEYRRLRKSLDNSTILMSINGTIGNLAFYKDEKVVLGKSAAYISANQKASKEFLYYTLQSNATKTFYENELTGTTIRNLSLGSIRNTPIPHPPTLAEQETIAEALSDADALIEAVEQLLTKKRQVKQGAMSELLTGKRRLSGFSGDWEVKEMGDLGLDISDGNYSGMYPKQSDFKAIGVPFIRANNIKGMKVIDDDMRFISTDKHNELLKGHLKKDDILITTRGELGNIALVPDMHIGSNINAQIVRINTRKTINHIYLAFYLSYEDVQNKIKGAETGSALKQLPVGKLVKIPVVLPPLPEQTAIAEILSDMDAEISALEEKLIKARQVKAGMMSELLTGKIRLV